MSKPTLADTLRYLENCDFEIAESDRAIEKSQIQIEERKQKRLASIERRNRLVQVVKESIPVEYQESGTSIGVGNSETNYIVKHTKDHVGNWFWDLVQAKRLPDELLNKEVG